MRLLSARRLKVERAGGGWCPKPPVEQGVREWLQVNFEKVHMITGIQTQGRFGNGRGLEYAEEYTVEYWRPGMAEWKPYKRWDGKQVKRNKIIFNLLLSMKSYRRGLLPMLP